MADQHQPSLTGIEIRPIGPGDATAAAEALARGMRDNRVLGIPNWFMIREAGGRVS